MSDDLLHLLLPELRKDYRKKAEVASLFIVGECEEVAVEQLGFGTTASSKRCDWVWRREAS
jgi:hypothetical protein